MRKIAIFIGSLQSGGAERVVTTLANDLILNNYNVTIVTYYDRTLFYDVSHSVEIISLEGITQSTSLLRNSIWLRRYIKKSRPDIFISFLWPFNILSMIVLIGLQIPKIVADRSDPRFITSAFIKFLRFVSYRYIADKVVFQTVFNRDYFGIGIKNKSIVIPNPTFISKENVGLGLKTCKVNKIVSVGRLIESKNYPLLIDAFSEIVKEFPDYILEIYGDGKLKECLQDSITEKLLNSKVFLKGSTQNIVGAISDAKLFVMTSNYEGMPNALVEAMSLGIPCICTKVSGATELIDDYKNGVLIECNDKDSLISTIRTLLIDQDLRDTLSNNAIFLAEKLSIENITNKWIKLFKSCLTKT